MFSRLVELLGYFKPYLSRVYIGGLLLVLSVIFEIVIPRIIRYMIDELNLSTNMINLNRIYFYSAIMFLVMLFRGVILYYVRLILISISRHIEYDIRNKLYKKLLTFEPAFFNKMRTGDLLSRMVSDIEQIRMVFGPGLMYSANVIILFILCFASMASIDLYLTIFAIIPLLLLTFLIRIVGIKYYEKSREVQEELANVATFVDENIQGIRVIKSYVKEAFTLGAFEKINLRFIIKNMLFARLNGLFRPLLMFIVGLSSIVILWVVGDRINKGEMTLGNLIEFFVYIEMLGVPLMAMGWVLSLFQRGSAAYDRIKVLFDRKSSILESKNSSSLYRLSHDITFKNLSFSYNDGDYLALDNVSFTINRGEKVAIIGPTGSGKTTLISLLLRLYEATPYSIFIDGKSITEVSLKDLRGFIGYIPQEEFIFPDTILENIKFGNNLDRGFLDPRDSARFSGLDSEINSFPSKYDELIGERGITLSGGQKQRLGIARALSSDPDVLVFDDSFSNIDSSTEADILTNIYKHFKNKTVIIVAHRASTIQNVDKVIVLDYGKVVEIGNPADLIKGNGYYANLLRHESLSY